MSKTMWAYEVNATKTYIMYIYHGDRTFAIVRKKQQHYLPLKRKLKLRWGLI